MTLPVVLRAVAPVFFLIGAGHLVLGVGAEVQLGAQVSAQSLADPVLDSQNRFYGVVFTVYGALLWLAAGDLRRYGPVVKVLLWVFLAGGVARLVSLAVVGVPTALVLVLTALELLIPPPMLLWLSRLEHDS